MTGWNFADVYEVVADVAPGHQAIVQGDRRVSWAEFDRRASGVAQALLDAGHEHGETLALCMYNCPEYLEAFYAAMKVGLVPANTNYRYGPAELEYLWDNADATVVVFHGELTDRVEAVRSKLPSVRTWLWVDDQGGVCPSWAVSYEEAAATEVTTTPPARSGDDVLLTYTGGTTGMPKGVAWRTEDVFKMMSTQLGPAYPDEQDLEFVRREGVVRPPYVHVCAAPLMHSSGCHSCLRTLMCGGTAVLLESKSFDPIELLDTVERERASTVVWIGDAFAKPVVEALDLEPDRWDLSSLTLVFSAGVMFSGTTKQAFLEHCPQVIISDNLGSSEAPGGGSAVSMKGAVSATGKFALGAHARVLNEAGEDVKPGSGEIGLLAVGGRLPIGYYKDPVKTAAVFKEIDGARYAISGDYAIVDEDGTASLLGRGSGCINTGGEKVFPEEVEEALKSHPAVLDAAVLGVPDERFGEAVVAVIQPRGADGMDAEALIAWVKDQLAGYKAPRRIVTTEEALRGPNGKVDYDAAKTLVRERLGAST